MRQLTIVILIILLPISPWIWKGIFEKDETAKVAAISIHIKLIFACWIIMAFIFGMFGGEIIDTLKAFY